MKQILTEELVLLVSVLKWIILAAFVGVVVGFSTSIFLLLLDGSIHMGEGVRNRYFLLPLAFVLSAFVIKHFAPDAEGHGTENVIEAVYKNSGRIKRAVVPIKLIATIITIGSGAPPGKNARAHKSARGFLLFLRGFSDLTKPIGKSLL